MFASKGGAPRNPDWYHNVRANPEVEVAGGRIRARARVAEGEERERIWRAQASEVPAFGSYQERTGRTIPVVILEPEE